MTTHVVGGLCLSVSAGTPATNDATGYGALAWTQISEFSSIGDLVTKHATSTFIGLCANKSSVVKGVEDITTAVITVGNDRTDAGQAIMVAARQSANGIYAFRLVESNGDKLYFRAFVLSEGTQFKSVNDVVLTPYDIGLVATSSGLTIIIVTASGGVATFELREDGTYELREDGTKELRE